MTIQFPRSLDDKGHAWGLSDENGAPVEVWERFSPDYEAQAERIVRAFEARGLTVQIDGAGSEDGEYVLALRGDEAVMLQHLENPEEAGRLAAMDDAALAAFLDEQLSGVAD